MADTITIPSPSVFLRASPDPVPRLDNRQQVLHDDPNKPAPKKRNTTRKKSTASTTKPRREGAAVAKPKQSKSRNGCVTCKAKRLKCDEKKPGCEQCKKRNVDCGGYKKDFKWRPFEETNVATNIAKQNNGSLIVLGSAADGSGKRSPASPPSRAGSSEAPVQLSSSFAQQLFVAPPDPPRASSAEKDRLVQISSRTSPAEAQAEPGASPTDSANDAGTSSQASPHSNSIADAQPKENVVTSNTMPGTKEVFDFDMNFMDEFLNMTDPPLMDEMDTDFDKNMGGLTPIVPDYDAWALQLSHCPTFQDDTSISSPPAMVFPQRITYMYEQPSLAQTSPEMLMLRFDRLTCGILSIKDGPNENPWRTLIWPMAQTSPALYHAISSMTAFHSSRDIPALRVAGHEHKSESVRNLLEGIEESTMNLDTAIATTLALAFAETWDQHLSSGNDHIQGARAMINIALNQHKQSPLTGLNLARLKFLANAWVYLDVLSRVTTADEDTSDDYDNLYCLYSTPESPQVGPSGHAGFGIDFGLPIDSNLDPLMGCASTLFPLIGRTANLIRRVYRAESNSPPMISQAMELKLMLETWEPPAFIEPPEDPTCDVRHALQTAEAYRWATLLYLHQALPEIPERLTTADMAKKVLVFLATVPLASRCVIIHVYPLFMAGCEADVEEDRQWIKSRWAAMSQRMRIGIIDKCVDVMEEVWRRRDEYKNKVLPVRRSLVATADLQPPGGNRNHRPSSDRRGSSFNSIAGASEGTMAWADKLRRMTGGDPGQMDSASISCRGSRDAVNGATGTLLTVRGRLHWIGVMKDWGWEVLLG
ncbi:hypothetical protein AUEXF2481DRAFT_4163 [Aureobasidium subglaciale EXF-2481]|uniref:Zn(2)-C6 fungal-type domain-containing protein n=1 Tax=Aureobasidium subglaciale (strain EXF-2481) TaxID=1043005 RepID=A0A074YFW5_AURSE|nr:uncharacterized protein AUEXF2481DRAFT_4163 [Aureobasidium subglaciale EXF-2481]KAI5203041.1 hypothetical protein E4T38_05395 [Aureobasidium subglaciale]KAI5221750.1 hypothetical protein E4T40_05328 [Aureobasidium subglaciale]KAI5225799.1 hypothetical protein E4T41_05147 [Aureobasidium subglaciale]KAI5261636.1 hypothetical protein E4T46_05039 [Aureobasidium subglaciale]KEQ96698.1 hypothetical protein AUEXF2481DRAFT_4163 [Aureobasidium subglaciale EXF-2481]